MKRRRSVRGANSLPTLVERLLTPDATVVFVTGELSARSSVPAFVYLTTLQQE